MNTYELIALSLIIFAFIIGVVAFILSLDTHAKNYAHDTTIGLGGPPNQKVKDINYYGGRKSNS